LASVAGGTFFGFRCGNKPFAGVWNRFPYVDEVLKNSDLPAWMHQFGNFDGVHYVRIASAGYEYQFTQAFFPLYPLLIKIVSPIF